MLREVLFSPEPSEHIVYNGPETHRSHEETYKRKLLEKWFVEKRKLLCNPFKILFPKSSEFRPVIIQAVALIVVFHSPK